MFIRVARVRANFFCFLSHNLNTMIELEIACIYLLTITQSHMPHAMIVFLNNNDYR